MSDAEQPDEAPTPDATCACAYAKKLETVIAVVDDTVIEISAFVAGITQADSERCPAPGAWSIGEILHHLILVLRHAGTLLRIIETQAPDRFDYSTVVTRRRFTLPDIADPVKGGKGVAPEPVQPSAGGDIQKMVEDFVLAWEESKARLRAVADRDLSRHYFEHYRLGPLNLYETIAFQGYHAQKHLAQMKQTLSAIH